MAVMRRTPAQRELGSSPEIDRAYDLALIVEPRGRVGPAQPVDELWQAGRPRGATPGRRPAGRCDAGDEPDLRPDVHARFAPAPLAM